METPCYECTVYGNVILQSDLVAFKLVSQAEILLYRHQIFKIK